MKGKTVSLDLEVERFLPALFRAAFIKELVKYLMVIRYQTPEPVDHLRKIVSSVQVNSFSKQSTRIADRKRRTFISQLDSVFAFIDDAFENNSHIPMVAIVFGATILSPKESYIITFSAPPPKDSSPLMKPETVMKKLLLRVVSQDLASKMQQISTLSSRVPTCIHVGLKGPRHAQFLKDFARPHLAGMARLSRNAMSVINVSPWDDNDQSENDCPNQGKTVCDNLSVDQLLRVGGDSFDISGIEPLRSMSPDKTLNAAESDLASKLDTLSIHPTKTNFELDPIERDLVSPLETEGDYIWFVSAAKIHGLKS